MEDKKKGAEARTVISLPTDVRVELDKIRGDFAYGPVIRYLLIKSGHIEPSPDEMKQFRAMDRYINGEE